MRIRTQKHFFCCLTNLLDSYRFKRDWFHFGNIVYVLSMVGFALNHWVWYSKTELIPIKERKKIGALK